VTIFLGFSTNQVAPSLKTVLKTDVPTTRVFALSKIREWGFRAKRGSDKYDVMSVKSACKLDREVVYYR
jgi:hypothetical protein